MPWSRVHQQRQVTTCLIKFAIGKRNVAIRYKFCIWLCKMNVTIIVHPTQWMFTNSSGFLHAQQTVSKHRGTWLTSITHTLDIIQTSSIDWLLMVGLGYHCTLYLSSVIPADRVHTDIKMLFPGLSRTSKDQIPGFSKTLRPFFQDFPGHVIFTNMSCMRSKKCIYKISYQCICITAKKWKCYTWDCIIVFNSKGISNTWFDSRGGNVLKAIAHLLSDYSNQK